MIVLRILKWLFAWVAVSVFLLVITVGLVNTYTGVDSRVRNTSDRVVSMLPWVEPILGRVAGVLPTERKAAEVVDSAASADRGHSRGAAHQAIDDATQICAAPDVSEVPIWSGRKAYAWVNEDGVRSFGDEAPSTLPKHTLSLDAGDREFSSKLIWDDVPEDRSLEGQLRGGAKRIYEQWGTWIGRDALIRSQITVRIIGDRPRFIRDWGGDPAGPIPSGFYSLSRNEAVAFYDPNTVSDERLLEVVFHEVAHLVTTWQVGLLPPWYGEGLAEYFETMQVQWQSASFKDQMAWSERVARDGFMPLETLLALTASQWFTGDVHQRYSTAGALMAFLATSDSGRVVLRELGERAHRERCESRRSKSDWTPDSYPGGVDTLERDLKIWLAERVQ